MSRSKVSLVVAMDKNGLIGRDGGLPWHLPADLRHFKQVTMGHAMVMGRRTFESIGRPLPGRRNLVLSRGGVALEGIECVASWEELFQLLPPQEELMVIGGAALYREALAWAQRIYLTEIDAEFSGDLYFPQWNREEWTELRREEHEPDAKNSHAYAFVVLESRDRAETNPDSAC